MGVMTTAKSRTVGAELAAVLPQTGQPWYKNGGLLKLNFCIFSIIMFCENPSRLAFPENTLTLLLSSLRQRIRRLHDEWSPDLPSLAYLHEQPAGCLARLYQCHLLAR